MNCLIQHENEYYPSDIYRNIPSGLSFNS